MLVSGRRARATTSGGLSPRSNRPHPGPGKHQAGGVRNTDSAAPAIDVFRPQMDILAVALVTIAGKMGEGGNLPDLMADKRMTTGTFDLVVGDIFLVQDLGCKLGGHDLGFVMTLDALSFRDMAIPLNHAQMALFTGNPSGNIFLMVKTPAFDFDVAFRLNMTRSTASDRTGDAVFLSFGAALEVMTDEAVGLVDGKVCSLNNLGMAGRTAKFHPSS